MFFVDNKDQGKWCCFCSVDASKAIWAISVAEWGGTTPLEVYSFVSRLKPNYQSIPCAISQNHSSPTKKIHSNFFFHLPSLKPIANAPEIWSARKTTISRGPCIFSFAWPRFQGWDSYSSTIRPCLARFHGHCSLTTALSSLEPARFFPVALLRILSDLFRGQVTSIWVIKRSLGRSWWMEKLHYQVVSNLQFVRIEPWKANWLMTEIL